MPKDFYLVLQVTRGATADQIHSAYRRRALELHPDRSGAGSEPFIELQQAYSVLSDPQLRAAYDNRRQSVPIRRSGASRSGRPSAEPLKPVEPVSGFDEISLSRSFATFGPCFDEIFDRLWTNFKKVSRPKSERLESLNVDATLTSTQARAGGAVRIYLPGRFACRSCRGRGEVGMYTCWRCQGQGALTGEYPLEVSFPAGLVRDYVVQVPLESFGIKNFYLTVRFRPAGAED